MYCLEPNASYLVSLGLKAALPLYDMEINYSEDFCVIEV